MSVISFSLNNLELGQVGFGTSCEVACPKEVAESVKPAIKAIVFKRRIVRLPDNGLSKILGLTEGVLPEPRCAQWLGLAQAERLKE